MICGMCHKEECDCLIVYGFNDRVEFAGFPPDGPPPSIADGGTKAWEALHRCDGCEPSFLANFETLIPCGECLAFYREYKASVEPQLDTPDAFFAWGVGLHNAVNRKLGKPEMSLDEARVRWGRPAPR